MQENYYQIKMEQANRKKNGQGKAEIC